MYHGYKADALKAGVDAYLLKGCPPDYLLDAILDRERLPVEVR
jgi:DNA-binding NarL/FixJ family response regulator